MIDADMLKQIAVVAFETVGVIELLKNWLKIPLKFYSLLLIPAALTFGFVYAKLPPWATVSIMATAACQLGYDIILQGLKKIISRIAGEK
jgi:hypothetical protein